MIDPSAPITNFKIVSAIRSELSKKLVIDDLQEVLAQVWHPLLSDKHVCMTDATCYESHLRYPTDMKLLWEIVEWLHRQIIRQCGELHIRRPRNKFDDVSRAYLSYCKKRKRKTSRTRMLRRRLLHLLEKLLLQIDEIRKVKNLIVSIDKHYIRPIVREKESKNVEFGAKVNNIQIDGISFIEHLSFNAFNEGIRLKECINLHQRLMRRKVKAVAADSIYATNENRKYCTSHGITTSFVRKGKAAKDEQQRKLLRSELSKERATRMEGSFGTQKQYYSLDKVKARNQNTEILWKFFGIHTSNAVLMAEKSKNIH